MTDANERDYSREDYAPADPELLAWHPILEKFVFIRKSEVRKNPGKGELSCFSIFLLRELIFGWR
jgi:hypothetical protein